METKLTFSNKRHVEKYSDKTILNGIKNRKDSVLEYLYKDYFPQVLRIVVKNGGVEQDARDLFQEALIIIFNRLRKDELKIESSFHNYFIVLCRFIWFRQNNIKTGYGSSRVDEDKLYASDDTFGADDNPGKAEDEGLSVADEFAKESDGASAEMHEHDSSHYKPGKKEYEQFIASQYEKIYQRNHRKMPGDCKRVLKMFFKKRSFREISQKMRYSGEEYARRKKYLCMQHLMKMINEDPQYQDLKKREQENDES